MKIIVVLGPTGIGKSQYALSLAQQEQGEIVSVDSMQIYKYMDIGTAKLSLPERLGIPHHLIDIVDPSIQYSVADYITAVKSIIAERQAKLPALIFCGGTGLYLNALLNGLGFPIVGRNDEVRRSLTQRELEHGKEALWQELNRIDPAAAQKIHPNDSYRTKRALEVYETTGRRFSELAIKTSSVLGEHYQVIGLTADKSVLHQRSDARVDRMIEAGLIDEVKSLLAKGYSPELSSMQAIGYKELVSYLENKYTLAEAVEQIKKATRALIKRQYTWFRAFKNINWQEVGKAHD